MAQRPGNLFAWIRAAGAAAACVVGCAQAWAGAPSSPVGTWAFTGGGPHHPCSTRRPFPTIIAPRWTRDFDNSGLFIHWVWQAGPVVTRRHVIAVGNTSATGLPPFVTRVYALDRNDGGIEWTRDLPALTAGQYNLGSQSSLAFNARNDRVVAVQGRWVIAIDVADGSVAWQRELPRNIVNATPVITDDLGKRNRLFITDFDGASPSPTSQASLHCINVDPFDAVENPHTAGDIIWSTPMFGSSGNTPAYLPRRKGGNGLVFVGRAGHYGQAPGSIRAYPADAVSAPSPVWDTANTINTGFFGGVTIVPTGASGRTEVFGATYAFFGGLHSANLVRLDAATGAFLGTALTNRTSSIPIVMPGGHLLVTGGLQSSVALADSVPTLALYNYLQFDPNTPTLAGQVWEAANATWVDLDFDGEMDPGEYLAFGGYTHHPVLSLWRGVPRLAVGTIAPGDRPAPSELLSVVNIALGPTASTFVEEIAIGAGGSPVLAGPNLYSVGTGGLNAFGPEPQRFDINVDGEVGVGDVVRWERGFGLRDIDDDGSVTAADREVLVALLRAEEPSDMLEGRR